MFISQDSVNKSCIGLSLLEMLVALLMMSVLLIAFNKLLYVYQSDWQKQSLMHKHQEVARKVFSLIRDSVHTAGHVGCRRVADNFMVKPYGNVAMDRERSLRITNHKLEVMRQHFPSAVLIKPMRNTTLLYLDAGAWFHRGQYLIIADCYHAEIFQVAAVTPERDYQIVRSVRPLAYRYDEMAEVGRLDSREIFTDGCLTVYKRMTAERLCYAEHVGGLEFSDDGAGLSFKFITHFGNRDRYWYGYASRWE